MVSCLSAKLMRANPQLSIADYDIVSLMFANICKFDNKTMPKACVVGKTSIPLVLGAFRYKDLKTCLKRVFVGVKLISPPENML